MTEAQGPLGTSQTPPQAPSGGTLDKDSRLWGMLCHLTALAGYIMPFGHIIGPLIIWLIKREELPFADEQGKESLNFQISVTIYGIVAALLILVFVGAIILFALAIFNIVMIVMASVKANKGEHFRYPLSIRFIQ